MTLCLGDLGWPLSWHDSTTWHDKDGWMILSCFKYEYESFCDFFEIHMDFHHWTLHDKRFGFHDMILSHDMTKQADFHDMILSHDITNRVDSHDMILSHDMTKRVDSDVPGSWSWLCMALLWHEFAWYDLGKRVPYETNNVTGPKGKGVGYVPYVHRREWDFFVLFCFCFVFSTVQHGNVKEFYEQSICT